MSDESDPELAARIRLAVTRLSRALRQQSPSELSLSQQAILATLNDRGPVTAGELAAREQVSAPTISRSLDRMERDGLVTRCADRDDRRIIRVSITEEGALRLHQARTRRNAWLALRIGELDADQRARLVAAVDVIEALTSIPDPDPQISHVPLPPAGARRR